MRNRAFRRHQRKRAIKHAREVVKQDPWYDKNPTQEELWEDATFRHKHLKGCSCDMCGNPRHNSWSKTKDKLTLQEKKFLQKRIDY